MNSTKKILSLVLVFIMMLAMGVTAFADGTNVPKATDTATVTIKNVEAGATVTLYQIVKPIYNDAGLVGYEPVVTDSIDDLENPTAEEITKLAGTTLSNPVIASANTDGDYTATVGAGTYLVLVKGAGATVYNPMIVSVNYDENSAPAGGTVDAKTNWTLEDAVIYAKSGTPTVDKKITGTNPTESNDECNENGNDVAIGDTVNFEIDTAIPSYSAQYTTVTFKISDTLDAGFNAPSDIVVKVGGSSVTAGDETYTLTTNGNSFEISFASSYVLANGLKDVVVTYKAVVNANAELNFDPNTNTAKITFTNDPTDSSKTGTDEDKTYTYTFAIDGELGGTSTTQTYKTHEVIKVDQDGEVEVVSEATDDLDEIKVTNPLAGAVFTLTNTATNKVYTGTSDANGYLVGFTGLDAGTYNLVETQAPAGYAVDTTVHTVVITADYNEDGTLATYTITIDGESTSTYTATYEGGTIKELVGTTQDTLAITNTPIPELPSTGGIGTTLFYVIGSLMVVAAGVVLVTKKRMSNKG